MYDFAEIGLVELVYLGRNLERDAQALGNAYGVDRPLFRRYTAYEGKIAALVKKFACGNGAR